MLFALWKDISTEQMQGEDPGVDLARPVKQD
jgi:hypothetical protein